MPEDKKVQKIIEDANAARPRRRLGADLGQEAFPPREPWMNDQDYDDARQRHLIELLKSDEYEAVTDRHGNTTVRRVAFPRSAWSMEWCNKEWIQ